MKELKIIMNVFFLLTFSSNVQSQTIPFENGYWIPQKFINALIKDKKTSNYYKHQKLEKPISTIVIKDQQIWIRTYRSEFNLSDYKFVNSTLLYLKHIRLNLAPFGRAYGDKTINKYIGGNFYLERKGKNTMYLIAKANNYIDTISFTHFINGCPIIDDDATLQGQLISKTCN